MRQDIAVIRNANHIVGQLRLPDETQSGERLPGVVVVGPASSVKGQVPTIYAGGLAVQRCRLPASSTLELGSSRGPLTGLMLRHPLLTL